MASYWGDPGIPEDPYDTTKRSKGPVGQLPGPLPPGQGPAPGQAAQATTYPTTPQVPNSGVTGSPAGQIQAMDAGVAGPDDPAKLAAYREAAKAAGQRVDEGDRNVYDSGDYQGWNPGDAFPLPQNATPAQQWNAQPQGDFYKMLMERINQGPVDSNSASVRRQVDPLNAQAERASRNYLDQLAEKSGGLANLQGERRLASERTGQAAGRLESEVIGRMNSENNQNALQALGLYGNYSLGQQGFQQQDLNRSSAMDQFLRELALRESNQNNQWDYNWAQVGG